MHEHHLALAVEMSRRSVHPKFTVGAVLLLSDGNIVTGINKWNSSHPLQQQFNAAHRPWADHANLHAEMDALTRINAKCDGAVLYVARTLKFGTHALAKPCGACQAAALHFGIKTAFYTVDAAAEHVYEKLEISTGYIHRYGYKRNFKTKAYKNPVKECRFS